MDNPDNSIFRELIIETDYYGQIISTSNNCYNILGYKMDEIINRNIKDFIVWGNNRSFKRGKEKFNVILKYKDKGHGLFDVLMQSSKNTNNDIYKFSCN